MADVTARTCTSMRVCGRTPSPTNDRLHRHIGVKFIRIRRTVSQQGPKATRMSGLLPYFTSNSTMIPHYTACCRQMSYEQQRHSPPSRCKRRCQAGDRENPTHGRTPLSGILGGNVLRVKGKSTGAPKIIFERLPDAAGRHLPGRSRARITGPRVTGSLFVRSCNRQIRPTVGAGRRMQSGSHTSRRIHESCRISVL